MFDGSFKSKRAVKLGGRNELTRRSNFVDRAKRERLDRKLVLQRISSCIVIQSTWRMYAVLRTIRREFKAIWQKKVENIVQLMNIMEMKNIEYALPVQVVQGLIREFLVLKKYTLEEMEIMAKIWKISIKQQDVNTSYSLNMNAQRRFQMDQMVDILTKQLYTMVVKNEKSNLVKNSLDVLDMFIQGMHFDKDTKIAVQVKASSKILQTMVDVLPFYQNEIASRMVKCAFFCLDGDDVRIYKEFGRIVLSTPALTEKKSTLHHVMQLCTSDVGLMWKKVLQTKCWTLNGNAPLKLIQIGNLLSLADALATTTTLKIVLQALDEIGSVREMDSITSFLAPQVPDDEMMQEDEGLRSTAISALRSTINTNALVKQDVPQKVSDQFKLLHQVPFMATFLRNSLHLENAADIVFRMARLMLTFFGASVEYGSTGAASGMALQLLNELVVVQNSNSFLNQTWNIIQRRVQNVENLHSFYHLGSTNDMLFVFLAAYSHSLMSLDNASFMSGLHCISASDSRSVVYMLRDLLYNAYWTEHAKLDQNAHLFHLFMVLTATRVYNQLYDRQLHLQFCEKDAWIWPSILSIEAPTMFDDTVFYSGNLSNVLSMLPQVLPFEHRLDIFHSILKSNQRSSHVLRFDFGNTRWSTIRRQHIYRDSKEYFFSVLFVNEQGLEEAGIDGGGVYKEYIDSLTKECFDPENSFFAVSSDGLVYPNAEYADEGYLLDYEFIGMVLGKAVYEEILVEPQFAPFFLNKLLAIYNYFDDLVSMDPELHTQLVALKKYDGDFDMLDLDFTVTSKQNGSLHVEELCRGGQNMPVTKSNYIKYINLMAHFKLNVHASVQCGAFLRGFRAIIPVKWIRLFSTSELHMLISGSNQCIDVEDWKRHTVYSGGYHPSQPMIQWYWELIESFSPMERSGLLKFITSCSRQPLRGFSSFAPVLCIQQVRAANSERLPSSATCMNLLKLPTYASKKILRQKLLYAIQFNSGFELS